MAHTVLIKRSSTSSSSPSGAQLAAGELAINTVDEKLFFKNSSGTVKSLSAMSDLTSNLVTISTSQTISGAKTLTNALTLNAQNELRFADSDSSNYVSFRAPGTVAANNIYTFPAAVGSANQVLAIDTVTGSDATLKWYTVSAGGTPGGSDTYVQFNDGGSTFGGDAGLTYNKTTDTLTVAGDLAVNGGDLTSTSAAVNVFNNTSTTVNIGGAATSMTLGANSNAASVSLVGGVMQVKRSGSGMAYYAEIVDNSASGLNIGGSLTGMPITIGDYGGGGNSTNIVVDDSSAAITFYTGTGIYTFPGSNGSNGQVLTTDGAGTLSWSTVSGGGGVSQAFAIAMAIAL